MCTGHCLNDSNCVDALFIMPSTCYTFRANGVSTDVGQLSDKCSNVVVNSTMISYSPPDISDIPNINCDTVISAALFKLQLGEYR
ncbi:hypothetical protein DPMN_156654 [Dreissena polymorpha]|uniref:Uncharacterized protein n=1 Tax=Dreissena polymorpha TaxID=45954 RepID=A0A9D4J7S1_DREPO|nr:hypothetical protein DPMN_156654 [Dreissena polymorpha]